MNETQQSVGEQESKRAAKRRRRAERLTESPVQTSQDNVHTEENNDSYAPPQPQKISSKFSVNLYFQILKQKQLQL